MTTPGQHGRSRRRTEEGRAAPSSHRARSASPRLVCWPVPGVDLEQGRRPVVARMFELGIGLTDPQLKPRRRAWTGKAWPDHRSSVHRRCVWLPPRTWQCEFTDGDRTRTALLYLRRATVSARGRNRRCNMALAPAGRTAGNADERAGHDRSFPSLAGPARVSCPAAPVRGCAADAMLILSRAGGWGAAATIPARPIPNSRLTSRRLGPAPGGRSHAAIHCPMHRGRTPTASPSSGFHRHWIGRSCHRASPPTSCMTGRRKATSSG